VACEEACESLSLEGASVASSPSRAYQSGDLASPIFAVTARKLRWTGEELFARQV
jgi:hypothetical protein